MEFLYRPPCSNKLGVRERTAIKMSFGPLVVSHSSISLPLLSLKCAPRPSLSLSALPSSLLNGTITTSPVSRNPYRYRGMKAYENGLQGALSDASIIRPRDCVLPTVLPASAAAIRSVDSVMKGSIRPTDSACDGTVPHRNELVLQVQVPW